MSKTTVAAILVNCEFSLLIVFFQSNDTAVAVIFAAFSFKVILEDMNSSATYSCNYT